MMPYDHSWNNGLFSSGLMWGRWSGPIVLIILTAIIGYIALKVLSGPHKK